VPDNQGGGGGNTKKKGKKSSIDSPPRYESRATPDVMWYGGKFIEFKTRGGRTRGQEKKGVSFRGERSRGGPQVSINR